MTPAPAVQIRVRPSPTRQLIVFFALAFGIGWLAFLPVVLYQAFPAWSAFLYLYSPALSALITAFWAQGPAGIRGLLRRYWLWRFPIRWYLLAVFLLPVIFLVTGLVALGQTPSSLWTGSPWYFLIASFGFLMIINSGEEIGWRGFALIRLQGVVKSPLAAAIVLGVLWGLWHLPLYLNPAQSSNPLPLFLLFITGLSLVYSVLFNQTRGSLLLAVLLHAGTDIAPRFMQIANLTPQAWLIIVALTWGAALSLYLATRNAPAVTEATPG